MELGDRLVHVRSTVKHEKPEKELFTQDDIVFIFSDIVRPVGLILNNNDPLECFVLFPPATPMQDIIDLSENPSWVGASMQLGIYKPTSAMLTIVNNLLQDKEWEEGEDYEYTPIPPLDPEDHSTPKKKGGPAAPKALTRDIKHMPTGASTVVVIPSAGNENKTGCIQGFCPWCVICLTDSAERRSFEN